MTVSLAIGTFIGAFVFPFMIRLMWGRMQVEWKTAGGFIAIIFIVAIVWAFNHGAATPLIYQSGSAWVDQAWAAGIGVFVATTLEGGSIKKAFPTILAAGTGGVLAALVLSGIL